MNSIIKASVSETGENIIEISGDNEDLTAILYVIAREIAKLNNESLDSLLGRLNTTYKALDIIEEGSQN